MARWERWEGSEVAKWRRWESGEVGRWKVPGFIQGWKMQDESKFIFLFLMLIKERNGRVGFRDGRMERLSLDHLRAVKNIVECGSVWNL